MRTAILTLLLGLILTSCGHERDLRSLRKVFSQTHYDTAIIQSLPVYDRLKSIITANLDTIFKYRNSRNFVFYENGKDTATIREDANSYDFYYNYGAATSLSYGTGPNDQKLIDEVSVENMPAYIYPSVDTIFKGLGKGKIRGFTLWTDSTIEIYIKGYSIEDIEVTHTLAWKRTFAKNTDLDFFYKDTLIAPNWTYSIWMDEYRGW